jgi:hypothetical protein
LSWNSSGPFLSLDFCRGQGRSPDHTVPAEA